MKFIVFLIVAFTPTIVMAQDSEQNFLDIQEVTSDTGLNAWLVEDHSIPIIALKFSFRGVGAKTNPSDKQGLARLVSNTMDEGAGEIVSQEFQKTLNDLSISLSFNASRDNFGGSLKTLSRNKATAFKMLKLALNTPRFDDEPVERMRQANKSRIRSSLSNPKWMAARLQNDRIFEGHPYALNSGGTLSSLDNITSDDLRKFHKALGRNQLVISAAGDITKDELASLLDDVFGGLPIIDTKDTVKYELQNAGQTYLYKQDIPQTIIEISQKGVSRQDPDYYSAKLMNFILGESGFGSRLMDEAREKNGLTYGIYSYFYEYDEMDVMHVSTSTASENTVEMLALINDQWDRIKNYPVEDTELSSAKSYIIGSLPLALTSTNSIAAILLSLQMDGLPINYLDKRGEMLENITVNDIQDTAKRVLNADSFTTILVGSPQGLGDLQIITELPNVE